MTAGNHAPTVGAMVRTLSCSCGETFAGATGEELLTAVERHALIAHAEVVVMPARGLTEREEQVAALVAVGASNGQVAAELDLSRKTVETHLTRIYRKLGVRSRAELSAARRAPRPNGPLCETTFPTMNEGEVGLKRGEGSR